MTKRIAPRRRAARSKTWLKIGAFVPVAAISGVWSFSLATAGASASAENPSRLPDGSRVPAEAIDAPASVTFASAQDGTFITTAKSVSTDSIPVAALAAYQRAAQVIAGADSDCGLDWTVLAAIGLVETNHGRANGSSLSDDGLAEPPIYGVQLDGSNGTPRIGDTDGGQYDTDDVFDRAVGPLQFIPSTWQIVGVDGDSDDARDPQDIDDAALAAAVHLCSGDEDLASDEGLTNALLRWNDSADYAELVKQIAAQYALSAPSSGFDSIYAGYTFGDRWPSASSYNPSAFDVGPKPAHVPGVPGTSASSPSSPAAPDSPAAKPGTGSPGGGGTTTAPEPEKGKDPVSQAIEDTTKAVGDTVKNVTGSVVDLVGFSWAKGACTDEFNAQKPGLVSGLLGGLLGGGPSKAEVDAAIDECAHKVEGTPEADAQALVEQAVRGLLAALL